MKNNKLTPQSMARRAAFYSEFGGPYPTKMPDEFNQLVKELIGVDTEEQKGLRIAMESTAQGNRENSPELYGMSLRQTRQKYAGEVLACNMQARQNCDVELNEIESSIVASMGHNQDLNGAGEIKE